MRLPRFFGKLRKLRPLLLRRIVGNSMLPRFDDGDVVVASNWFKRLKPHDIVIIHHDGREKIKRIERREAGKLFLLGDNQPESTDSRHFGWVDERVVIGKVVWPRLTQANTVEMEAEMPAEM